jgi:predicted MarR family transcription regulator
MSNTLGNILGILRRRWPLILIAGLVAVALGVAVESQQPETFTAQARVQADSRALAAYPEITGVDAFLAELQGDAFSQQVAEAAGLPSDLEGGSIAAYALGSTGQIAVDFTSADKDVVGQVAPVLHDVALARFREVNSTALTRVRAIAQEDAAALDEITRLLEELTGPDRIGGRVSVWSMRNTKVIHDEQLRAYENAYTATGEVTTSATISKPELRTALGALILGLVAGAVVALAAERLSGAPKTA